MDFERTLYALNQDTLRGTRRYIYIALLLSFFGAWVAWMFLYPLTLFETSQKGRIEVSSRGSSVVSLITGRIVENNLVLGSRVNKGDVLLRLDDAKEREQAAAAAVKLAALRDQLKGRERQLAVESERLTHLDDYGRTSGLKADADLEKTRVAQISAREELSRHEVLFNKKIISSAVYDKLRHDEEQRRSELSSARLQKNLTQTANVMEINRVKSRLAELQSEIAELRVAVASEESALHGLQRDIQNHVIVAAIGGRIADVLNLEIGGVITPAERAATIIPDGTYRIVANFDPAGSLGKIREGQSAKIRLVGFPWLQYGALTAEVVRVGAEVHDGLVRVELTLTGIAPPVIPLQHGLPGVVEIAVDKVTPWDLLLRSVGKSAVSLRQPPTTPPSGPAHG